MVIFHSYVSLPEGTPYHLKKVESLALVEHYQTLRNSVLRSHHLTQQDHDTCNACNACNACNITKHLSEYVSAQASARCWMK